MFYSDAAVVSLLGPQVTRAVRLGTREAFQALQRWRQVFSAGLHASTGSWVLDHFDWHVLAARYYPCLRGERARREYLSQSASSLLVRFEEDDAVYAVETAGVFEPASDGSLHDWYISESNYLWTYVITHEESYGPYFARAMKLDDLASSSGLSD